MIKPSNYRAYTYAALSALCVAAAWLLPGGRAGALLGWAGVLATVLLARSCRSAYLPVYLSGAITNALGFFWLTATISDFGGFNTLLTALIFLLFVTLSAVQYLIFAFIQRNLPEIFDRWALSTACAWVVSEVAAVRIFPWHMGHTQIAFLPFVQIAALGGSQLVSFMMFWLSESLLRRLLLREANPRMWLAPLCFAAGLLYGLHRLETLSAAPGRAQEVAVVQANITVAQKHNVKFFKENTARYVALTKKIAERGKHVLAIWPETVLTEWVPDSVGRVENDPRLPYFGDKLSLLLGALTYQSRTKLFNSALAVFSDGSVPEPYHKRVLMPFGEYMPLAGLFPWLNQLNPGAAAFRAGETAVVFHYPMRADSGESYFFKVSPLICYEDVVQGLAREAVQAGAEVLVNLTNDAWFGRTAAPEQHHLIAAFRAIENGRFLVRSTNSGLTAVVAPSGATLARIAPFEEKVLMTRVLALDHKTPYNHLGNIPWWCLAALCALLLAKRLVLGGK
jgi:apolipoprotein N-acyltransferase